MCAIEKEIQTHILDMMQNPVSVRDLRLSYSQKAGGVRDRIRKTETGFEYCLFNTTLLSWNSSTRVMTILLSSYSATTVSRVKALLGLCFNDVSRRKGSYYIGDLSLDPGTLKFDGGLLRVDVKGFTVGGHITAGSFTLMNI